ncbi:MAG: ABC transporter ATP-binding protein, partial [Anaerolineae bacterium]|nr:ABC transporter ATP-binding protein [Anaerolineae bacterium]
MNVPLKRYWDLLVDHLRVQRGRFTLLAVLLLSSIGLQVLTPQLMRTFIDTAIDPDSDTSLVPIALAFIGLALVQQVVAVSAAYLGENVAWTAT